MVQRGLQGKHKFQFYSTLESAILVSKFCKTGKLVWLLSLSCEAIIVKSHIPNSEQWSQLFQVSTLYLSTSKITCHIQQTRNPHAGPIVEGPLFKIGATHLSSPGIWLTIHTRIVHWCQRAASCVQLKPVHSSAAYRSPLCLAVVQAGKDEVQVYNPKPEEYALNLC